MRGAGTCGVPEQFDGAVIEGQDAVAFRLRPPQIDHRTEPFRLDGRQVVGFGDVGVEVEQLPGLLVVVGARLVAGDCLPAVGPDGPVAEHLEVLDLPAGGYIGVVQGVGETRTGDRQLWDAPVVRGSLHSGQLQNGGGDVSDVVELVTDASSVSDAVGPVNNQRVADSPAVGVLLVPPHRTVPDLGPPPWVVRV